MLYLAREDEPERHRGTVLRIYESVFAPSEGSLRFVRPGSGAFNVSVWQLSYTRHLRELWRSDPGAFLTLIELASGGGDVTLVDGWGDEDYAPRRILGAALKQIAKSQRDEALRRARRGQGSDRVSGPAAPLAGRRTEAQRAAPEPATAPRAPARRWRARPTTARSRPGL